MNKDVIELFLAQTDRLYSSWNIKLYGGEPTLHPQLFEILDRLVSNGHTVSFTTNFSMSLEKQRQLVEVCRNKLAFVGASLHLSQIDEEAFLKRVEHFDRVKERNTDFFVTSVLTHENYHRLFGLRNRIQKLGVNFYFAHQKKQGRYVDYAPQFKDILSREEYWIENLWKTVDFQSFGVRCHTGHLFFRIGINGDCFRCYNQPPPWNYLGSLKDGSFRLYEDAKPCLSPVCTCTVPANRNMICFNSQARAHEIFLHTVRGCLRGYRLLPNYVVSNLEKLLRKTTSPLKKNHET